MPTEALRLGLLSDLSTGQAASIIGWTSAIAAYGPFATGVMIGLSISFFGTPIAFFYWCAIFYAANIAINWALYARKGAEAPC